MLKDRVSLYSFCGEAAALALAQYLLMSRKYKFNDQHKLYFISFAKRIN